MFKASLIICFLLAITSYGKLTPTDNFNITDFVGNWNVAGFFSTVDLGLSFYSCATFNVTLGTLSRLTMSLSYINTEQYQVVQNSSTVVPSPLNKADLISTTAPTAQNNYVVIYYNSTSGEAILVNSAVNLGFILSRSENPLANNYQATVTSVLNSNGVPLSNITYIFNRACDIGNLKGLTTFDASNLAGEYYGNAIFSTLPVLQGVECFTTKFEPQSNHLINITTNFTFTSGKIIYTGSSYIPLPQQPSVIANTQIKNLSPFVIIYNDAASETYAAVTGDGTKGFVFSSTPTISQTVLAQVQQALTQNGLVVSSSNFYTLSSVCQISGGIDWSVIMF